MSFTTQEERDLAAAKAAVERAIAIGKAPDNVMRPPIFEPLPEQEPPPRGVVLACGADLTPMPVCWLWDGWLALGKLHILAGAPGQGKTTIALALAAAITVGGRWPDGTRAPLGNVLVWSGEDDAADTLLPRLIAAGGERSRCYFIQGTRQADGSLRPFDPAHDLGALQEAIAAIGGVSLLVIDPVVSAVTGDSHKNTEVRRAMQPLVDLAAATNCAVLGITHFAKGGQGTDPAQRVVGSVAFTAVARVVLVAAKVKAEAGEDGEQEDRRILARSKSNIGPDDGGHEYGLEQTEVLGGIQASRIAWGKAVQGSARELLTDPTEEPDESNDAAGFLRGLLSDGPMPAKAIFKDADEAGYSRDTVKRASLKMGIEKRKTGMNGGWLWALPDGIHAAKNAEESTKSAKGVRFENTAPSHPSALSSVENHPEAPPTPAPDDGQEVPL